MNLKKILLTVVIVLFSFFFSANLTYGYDTDSFTGVITQIIKNDDKYQLLEVAITKGERKNELIYVENGGYDIADYQEYKINDKLLISYSRDLDNNDVYHIADYLRQNTLFTLFIIFIVVSIVITGTWGVSSLIGMGFSFLIIFKILLPLIIKGYNPVLVAVGSSILIIPVNFYLSHGFNKKTHVAIIGTIISLIITGFLAAFFISQSRLTGFSSEEAGFLFFEKTEINMVGIILAGIIVGTLGVLDDVTVSQSAIVFQLKSLNNKLKFKELYFRAMRIGKDHISSMINTLVLVYAGASMPLLLLFINNPRPISEVINYELIAEEIIRTLIGSIGLILAIPITTLIAVYFALKKN